MRRLPKSGMDEQNEKLSKQSVLLVLMHPFLYSHSFHGHLMQSHINLRNEIDTTLNILYKVILFMLYLVKWCIFATLKNVSNKAVSFGIHILAVTLLHAVF
jgi:hypothetical protein